MLPIVIRWTAYGAVFHLWYQSDVPGLYLLPWAIAGVVAWDIERRYANRTYDPLIAAIEEGKESHRRHFDAVNQSPPEEQP